MAFHKNAAIAGAHLSLRSEPGSLSVIVEDTVEMLQFDAVAEVVQMAKACRAYYQKEVLTDNVAVGLPRWYRYVTKRFLDGVDRLQAGHLTPLFENHVVVQIWVNFACPVEIQTMLVELLEKECKIAVARGQLIVLPKEMRYTVRQVVMWLERGGKGPVVSPSVYDCRSWTNGELGIQPDTKMEDVKAPMTSAHRLTLAMRRCNIQRPSRACSPYGRANQVKRELIKEEGVEDDEKVLRKAILLADTASSPQQQCIPTSVTHFWAYPDLKSGPFIKTEDNNSGIAYSAEGDFKVTPILTPLGRTIYSTTSVYLPKTRQDSFIVTAKYDTLTPKPDAHPTPSLQKKTKKKQGQHNPLSIIFASMATSHGQHPLQVTLSSSSSCVPNYHQQQRHQKKERLLHLHRPSKAQILLARMEGTSPKGPGEGARLRERKRERETPRVGERIVLGVADGEMKREFWD